MTNPLVDIQFDVPFEAIRAEHVEPAIDQLLAEAKTALTALAEDSRPATYDRTLRALESLGEKLGYAMGVVGHLESVATYPELRSAFNSVQPNVSAFFCGIPLNEGVWKHLKALAASPDTHSVSPYEEAVC